MLPARPRSRLNTGRAGIQLSYWRKLLQQTCSSGSVFGRSKDDTTLNLPSSATIIKRFKTILTFHDLVIDLLQVQIFPFEVYHLGVDPGMGKLSYLRLNLSEKHRKLTGIHPHSDQRFLTRYNINQEKWDEKIPSTCYSCLLLHNLRQYALGAIKSWLVSVYLSETWSATRFKRDQYHCSSRRYPRSQWSRYCFSVQSGGVGQRLSYWRCYSLR